MNLEIASDRLFDMPKKQSSFNEAVGKRLERLRLALGFKTIRGFAEALGVDEARYRSWEKGLNGLPPEIAADLDIKFGATLSWLYRGQTHELRVGLFEKLKKAAV